MAAAAAGANGSTNGNGRVSAAADPAPRQVLTQLSYSGTPRNPDGSAWPDEYALELREPQRRMAIFEEMGNDDSIAGALVTRTQDINSANWLLQSDDESDLGQQITAFVGDNIYPQLENLLRWLGAGPLQYGFAALEPVFEWSDQPFVGSITKQAQSRPTNGNPNGDRRIYLRKLAHIRQPAVYNFYITETGDLEYLHQYVFTGSRFDDVKIPGDKLLIRVYDRQGDDYYGLPPMRKCYKAWKLKTQLERLNLLHFDRFGVGVPKVTEPPGGLTPQERGLVMQFLKALRSGSDNALTLPNGTTLDIVTATGQLASAGLDWTKLYNLQINKVFQTQQNELGSTQTGARAVGETFDEQRQGVIQADCEDVANVINNGLIIPLVKWNFGPQQAYPNFNPSQRVRAKDTLAAELVQAKTAGMYHPRPEDEAWFRDARQMPGVDKETLKKEYEERDAAAKAAQDALTAAQQSPPTNDNKAPTDQPAPPQRPRIAARQVAESALVKQLQATLADGAPDPATPGESSYRTREYSAWEAEVLRPDVLMRDLDTHASRLVGELKDVLDAIDADLEQQVTDAANRGADALQALVRTLAVPDRLRRRLRSVLLLAAQRARDYGDQTVRNEIQRQLGPSGIGPQRSPRMPSIEPYGVNPTFTRFYKGAARTLRRLLAMAQTDAAKHPRDVKLEAEVDRAAEDEIARRETSARSAIGVALTQAAGVAIATLVNVVSAAIKTALISLSTMRTEQNVNSVINVAFGAGRTDAADAINVAAAINSGAPKLLPDERVATPQGTIEAESPLTGIVEPETPAPGRTQPRASGGGGRSGLLDENGDPIELVSKIYSAVMDGYTCDECAKWDGAVFPIDYPEDLTGVQCPNPRCEGGYSRCRCVWIYVTNKEEPPTVPAAKGPASLSRAADDRIIAEVTADFEKKLAQLRSDLATKHDPQPITLTIPVTIEAAKPGTTRTSITPKAGGGYEMTKEPTDG